MMALAAKTREGLREKLTSRKRAYQRTFSGELHARVVLEDLAQFCRAGETPFLDDERLTNVLIGRQEVWLRIQRHLHMSDDDLWRLLGGEKSSPGG